MNKNTKKGSTMNGIAWSENGGYIPSVHDYDMDMMKTGGKIDIKKKNLGKFTATKKATGKTTEELTHSSDPVTKKRAVFAQNAAKWKHEYGGLTKFVDGGDTDFDPNSAMVPGGQGSTMTNGPVGPPMDSTAPQTGLMQQEMSNTAMPGTAQDNAAWRAGMTDEQANKVLTDAQGNPDNVPMPPHQRTQAIGTGFNNLLGAGLATASYFESQRNAKQAAAYARTQGMTDNAFASQKLNTQGNKGDYTQQGTFRPNEMIPTKPSMYYPTMAYGGTIPGTSNQLDTSWYPGFDGNTSQMDPYARVGKTLPEVPEDMATINAEKQEKVLGSFTPDGMPALMNVDGPPHTEGGKNVAVGPNSFVYSDTKDLKIKDPAILKLFGATKTSTPAQLAGKYDLQKFTKVLADDNSDPISRKTAEVMVGNYSNKLNQLGQIQEAIKASKGMDNSYGQPIGQPQAKYGGLQKFGDGGDYDLPTRTVTAVGAGRSSYIAPMNNLPASPDNSDWQWNGIQPQRTGPQEVQVPNYTPVFGPDDLQADTTNTDTLGAIPANTGNVTYKPPVFTAPTPDKMGIANSMINLAGIHKYNAWEAPIGAVLPDTTFVDPTRALAANAEVANTNSYNAAISGNSKAARATALASQGQAGATAADIIGRYATENAGTANRASENAAGVMNKLQEMQAVRSNRLYQGNVTAAQQYDNATREGRNDLVKQEQHAWDDRQKYDLLNKTSPYYYIDPKTGARTFKSPEAEAAFNNATSGKGQGYSADTAENVNSIFQRLTKQPAYQSEHGRQEALKLAQRMAGVSEHETTSYDKSGSSKGMKESGIYSGPVENKYGGKTERRLGGMTNHQLKKFVSKQFGGMTL